MPPNLAREPRASAAEKLCRQRAAVAARADYVHTAIMCVDTWRGTFGQ
jgi:hypothetical protein